MIAPRIGRTLAAILVIVAGSLPLCAQSVYVDLGYYGDPEPPSSDFAAAAPTPGTWNRVGTSPATLVDTAGNATSITMTSSPVDFYSGVYDHPDTTGDVGRLMDDNGATYDGIGESVTLTVSGLQPGTYQVYTYTWRSAIATASTSSIDVNGVGAEIVEPQSNGFVDFARGEHYSLHTVTIGAAEDMNIVVTAVDDIYDQTFYAGFQIVEKLELFADGFETGMSAWSSVYP